MAIQAPDDDFRVATAAGDATVPQHSHSIDGRAVPCRTVPIGDARWLPIGDVPDPEGHIVAAAHHQAGVRHHRDAADEVLVAGDCPLQLPVGAPQPEGLVIPASHQPCVWEDPHTVDPGGVGSEGPAGPSVEVPLPDGAVSRAAEELPLDRGLCQAEDGVSVAVEGLLGPCPLQVPNNDGVVSGARAQAAVAQQLEGSHRPGVPLEDGFALGGVHDAHPGLPDADNVSGGAAGKAASRKPGQRQHAASHHSADNLLGVA
mmetsp:Transcript_25762/g.72099  ORF Transcript_25762/g.72099 Transcript_25762/m.72099 type:complete len:259 (-) Transcript_25762:2921-3697(-)